MTARNDPERQPLLRSHSSKYGTDAPRGDSNLIQTFFNSTNVLLGVGLLSLPLGIRYAGWIVGMLLLLFVAVVTTYTAKLLARCLDTDKTLITYTDLAYASYGPRACNITQLLFSFILIAACVALVILFGDIMNLLIPSLSVVQWKVACGFILVPLHFFPFSLLSFASMIGVAASLGLVVLTILAGILKDERPGSLRQPAATYLFPESWSTLPLSFGLIMSPWGGHASFPNLYRDMRHPSQYNKALVSAFSTTYMIDLIMAVCGYLMYGDNAADEILANILVTPGFPHTLLVAIVALVAVMPITKIPLSSRPLVTMIEAAAGLDPAMSLSRPSYRSSSGEGTLLLLFIRSTLRILVVTIIVSLAIVCPNFDVVMAFTGSALCLTICIILPLLFYLKLFDGRLKLLERVAAWMLICVATIMALTGTIWALVPKDTLSRLLSRDL